MGKLTQRDLVDAAKESAKARDDYYGMSRDDPIEIRDRLAGVSMRKDNALTFIAHMLYGKETS